LLTHGRLRLHSAASAGAAASAAAALGLLGQRLLAGGDAPTGLVLSIADRLVALLCATVPDSARGVGLLEAEEAGGDGGEQGDEHPEDAEEDGDDSEDEDPPNVSRAAIIRSNAAFGLLRLCTTGQAEPGSVAARPPSQDCAGGPAAEITAGVVAEAMRRLSNACGAAAAGVAHHALLRRLNGVAWPWGQLGEQLYEPL
jgi:hypothetical protein